MDGISRILERWTRPHPSIQGDVEGRRARLAAGLLLAMLPLCVAALLSSGLRFPPSPLPATGSLAVLTAYFLVRRGHVTLAVALALLGIEAALAFGVTRTDDHTSAMLVLSLFALPIAMAGVLLRTGWAIVTAVATVLLALSLDSSIEGDLLGPPDDHAFLLALTLGGVAVLAVAASVTLQAQAKVLTESAALLRQLAENIPEVFFIVSGDGQKVLYTSPAYYTVTGRSVEQSMANPMDWVKAVHPDDLAQVQAALAANEPEIAYRILHPNQGVKHIRARTFPVLGPDGRLLRIVGLAEDVTAAVKAREDLREAQRQRIHLMQQLAHDMASPLTPVKLQLRLLKGRLGDQEARSLEIMRRNTDHLERLVTDVRDVARLEGGDLKLSRRSVDVADLALQAAESLGPSATERQVRIIANVPEPAPVQADAGRITQVMYNLMGNALKFTAPGGQVTVAVTRADNDIEVAVSDTGNGMTPEQLARLFKPFSQVHDPSSIKRPEDRGSGLGLYISKGLIEAHGGSISATSDGPGKGTTFAFRLPLA